MPVRLRRVHRYTGTRSGRADRNMGIPDQKHPLAERETRASTRMGAGTNPEPCFDSSCRRMSTGTWHMCGAAPATGSPVADAGARACVRDPWHCSTGGPSEPQPRACGIRERNASPTIRLDDRRLGVAYSALRQKGTCAAKKKKKKTSRPASLGRLLRSPRYLELGSAYQLHTFRADAPQDANATTYM
jgi:hypothetical protein